MNIKHSAIYRNLYKLTVLPIIFLTLFHLPATGKDNRENLIQIEDSLVNILKTMPRDTTYLNMIGSIEQLLINSPRFLYYAELKEKEARLLNKPRYICSSMSDRAIYYSNLGDMDSFYYWKEKMDPLALELKEYNYYFFLCNLEVTQLIARGKLELAIQTANKMYETAKSLNSKEGLAAANLSIGRSLLSARKYKEAIKSYEAALSQMEKNNTRFNAWRMQAYNYLIILCEITNESKKGLTLAAEQEQLVASLQKANIGKEGTEPYMLNNWVELQIKKASFLIKLHQPKTALQELEAAKKNYDSVSKDTRMHYHLTYACYYEEICQYDSALNELKIADSFSIDCSSGSSPELMMQKARLLGHIGYKDEAINLYNEIILHKDSINNKWFDTQLNELRTIYDTDHLKLQNKDLELKNKHSQLQIIQMSLILVILILITTVLLFIRSYRLKKKLEYSEKRLIEEKEHLIQSQNELRVAKERAEEARDMALKAERKESFMANMSHEIRTPLNAIVGFSNLLVSDEELEPEERKIFIQTINQNCDLLLKLINDILELSRMESGKMSFRLDNCNLSDLTDEIYRTHQMMIPSGIEFLKTFPETPVYANTDPLRIKQVLTNFINNAIKFTPTGHIKVGYELNPKEQTVSLFVEDTGKGISEENQKKIFERFYKQDEFDQGTGLGLSICTVIAERLNGKLTIHSELGKGSRFAIVIPYIVSYSP